MTERTVPRTVLITGASSGIGLELARCFAVDQYHLLLAARSVDKLEHYAQEMVSQYGCRAEVIPLDLADPVAVTRLHEDITARGIQVDALVNNAGFGVPAQFIANDPVRVRDMLQVNNVALTQLLHLFVPGMVMRGYGEILNVGSTAGFQPGPLQAAYFASKAYVNSLTEALAEEMSDMRDIKVTCLCPGPTATGFADSAGMQQSLNFRFGVMDAASVAQAGYRGLKRGQVIVIPGLKNKLLTLSVRFSPRFAVRKIVRLLNS